MAFALKGFWWIPIVTSMATFEHRSGSTSRWLVSALALYLVLSGGAVIWVLIENASQTATIRIEAEKELLLMSWIRLSKSKPNTLVCSLG